LAIAAWATAVLATFLAAVAWWRLRSAAARRALAVCLAWPAVPLAVAWLVIPSAGPPQAASVVGLIAVATVGWWLHRAAPDRRPPPDRGHPRWIWPGLHLLLVAAFGAAGLAGDGFGDTRALLRSLLLYPLYAAMQLFLVLVVLWPRLRLLAGPRPAGAVITVSLLFALIHWPNAVLMGLTGTGMVFWSLAHDRGRSLVLLAASMGLLATLAAQGLPDQWTSHMRAGPRSVRMRTVPPLAAGAHQATRHLPHGRTRTLAYLAAIHEPAVGRGADPDELDRWWRSVDPCRRGMVAWLFFISDEYRRTVAADPTGVQPPPPDVPWTRAPAPWPGRIAAFTTDADEPWDRFIRRCYQEILGREATPHEVSSWRQELTDKTQRRLLEVMLDHRRQLAAAPFDTLGCASLELHH
jgi:hypothetical protein